ncbi:mycothiol transferase [Spirosoma arcticum]
MESKRYDRRKFVSDLATYGIGAGALLLPRNGLANGTVVDENINHVGPKVGFTPQIGTLISMLDWVSDSVIKYNSKLTVEQLDYLHDKDSNTIGSLMMHLAATEVIYQDLTYHDLKDFSEANKSKWNVAMKLEENAREQIKGNPLSYYKDAIDEVRATTKTEMKKRDDAWLLSGETKDWDWNNYCKWFHVTEHYANHRGQMTWYAKRMPK